VTDDKFRADVDKAMRIIGPSARRAIVEQAVEFGRELVERQRQVGGGVASARKRQRAAKRLVAAIHKTEAALRDPDLDSSLREDFPADAYKALSQARFADDDIASIREGIEPQDVLKIFREDVEDYVSRLPIERPGIGPERAAVMLAAELLEKLALPITTTRTPTKSKFLLLAAVFYGDPGVNLYKYCCMYKKPTDGRLFGLNT
jgi:hypothetical protein